MKIVVHYNNIVEPKAYVFTDEEENEAKEKLVYIYRKKLLEYLNDNYFSFIDSERKYAVIDRRENVDELFLINAVY